MRVFTYERAGAVVVDGDHVLLCSSQAPGEPRWWHFPGGGIEPGETPAEAAVRELFEETGLTAVDAREVMVAGVQGGIHHYFAVTCDDVTIGAVTGPELEQEMHTGFKAEWVPIASLPSIPVWPRCVAEHLAAAGNDGGPVAWVEDDRNAWDGVPGTTTPDRYRSAARAVIVVGGRVAAIDREHDGDRWWTLPGGGVVEGESVEEAAVREAEEELGLRVTPRSKLAVVLLRRRGLITLQTYIACDVVGGTFGTGTGDEHTETRQAERGSYTPVWLDLAELPTDLRPSWLHDRLARWVVDPELRRAERFCELHDD